MHASADFVAVRARLAIRESGCRRAADVEPFEADVPHIVGSDRAVDHRLVFGPRQ